MSESFYTPGSTVHVESATAEPAAAAATPLASLDLSGAPLTEMTDIVRAMSSDAYRNDPQARALIEARMRSGLDATVMADDGTVGTWSEAHGVRIESRSHSVGPRDLTGAVTGTNWSQSGYSEIEGFRSQDEATQALSDPRIATDEQYRALVHVMLLWNKDHGYASTPAQSAAAQASSGVPASGPLADAIARNLNVGAFRSRAEVTAAMNSLQYAKDPAFRADVMARLAVSPDKLP